MTVKTNRIISVFLAILMIIPGLCLFSNAEIDRDNKQIVSMDLIKTPKVDGIITESEGWSAKLNFNPSYTFSENEDNIPATGTLRFSYSKEGLYIAAIIGEDYSEESKNSIIVSSDVNTDENYGFDGDTLSFVVDPLMQLEKTIYQEPARYNISFVGDSIKMYRTRVNDGDITDDVSIAGRISSSDKHIWQCECMIPWSLIVKDMEDYTDQGELATAEEVSEYLARTNLLVSYIDRYSDDEEIKLWNRTMCTCIETYDEEILESIPDSDMVKYCGIELINNDTRACVGRVSVKMDKTVNPTLDGVITDEEGWSEGYVFAPDSVRSYPTGSVGSVEGYVYFAYSDSGLYIATDMSESSDNDKLVLSTDEVNTDGDSILFMIDPLAYFEKTNIQVLPVYSYSIVGQSLKVYHTVDLMEEITALCSGAVKYNLEQKSWQTELYIPWSVICEDINSISDNKYEITPEDLSLNDGYSNVSIGYINRSIDGETSEIYTSETYYSVVAKSFDSLTYDEGNGNEAKFFGIKLENEFCLHFNTEILTFQNPTDIQKGYKAKFCKNCGERLEIITVPRLESENPFADIPEGTWYTEAAVFCNVAGFMNGTAPETFSPEGLMTRAMAVQVIAKVVGANVGSDSEYAKRSSFTDVPKKTWYHNAVEWASENAITSGVGDGLFGPARLVTREQLSVFIMKAAELLNCDISARYEDMDSFIDFESAHDWAKDSLSFCVASGIISGTSSTNIKRISPRAVANRNQFAVMIEKFYDDILTYPEIPESIFN